MAPRCMSSPSVRAGFAPRPLARACAPLTAAALMALAAIAAGAGAARAQSNPCAAFGPGFQKMPGSDSCVKAGGAVRFDAYTGGNLSSNPGAGSTPTGTSGATAPAPAAPSGATDNKSPPTAANDPWRQAR